jgi:glycosyltransferase involved in cell wall biosynthesis
MIHICHISQSAGGVETYINGIIQYTDYHHFRHSVICSDNGTLSQSAYRYGANVYTIDMPRDISYRDCVISIKIGKILRSIKPDVIHAHSGKGGVYGRIIGGLYGYPVIFTPNGFSFLGQKGVKRVAITYIEKVLSKTGALLLPVSQSEMNCGLNIVGWSDKKVKYVFPNSINPSAFENKINSKAKDIQIVTVGRVSNQKNPKLFAEIAAYQQSISKQTKFVWVGAGYAEDASGKLLHKNANKRDSNIIILPWVSGEEVRNIMQKSSIYLSTAKYEGMPFSIMEAMGMGLPIIASKVAGNMDLVQNNINGFLCDGHDEYVAAINNLVANSSLREIMGRMSAKIICEKYDIRKNINRLADIYIKMAIGK